MGWHEAARAVWGGLEDLGGVWLHRVAFCVSLGQSFDQTQYKIELELNQVFVYTFFFN